MVRIFISSPFEGLHDVRQSLAELVRSNAAWEVVWAEDDFDYDAKTDIRLWSVYEAAQSDAGLVILNGGYGTYAPGARKSYTHLEIDALNAVCTRTVVLRLPDAPHRKHPRKFAQMLDAALRPGTSGAAPPIELDGGADGVSRRGDVIRSALSTALSAPLPEGATQAQLVYATAALQSRLWRIVSANRRSFRGAYKTLRFARASYASGAAAEGYKGLAPAHEFLSSTLQRFAMFDAARLRAGAQTDAIAAIIRGALVWGGGHPLARLYGADRAAASDWTPDISRLAADRAARRLTVAENADLDPVGYIRRARHRYPALVGDLLGIVDTDLKGASPDQPITWNRIKLLSNELTSLLDRLDPKRTLVPEQDRAPLRFRLSWRTYELGTAQPA